MARALLLFAALALLAASARAGFYGKGSNVVELSTKNFAAEVFPNNEVWMVEFYAPWCGHCKNLAPHWEQAATKLKGLARVAAVNCDEEENKALAQYFGIQGFPTIKVFGPDITENEEAKGKPFKNGRDYQGQRTADAIVQHALGQLKYYGEDVTDGTAAAFEEREGAKVLLFSDKKATTSLYKALSAQFARRLAFGQVHSAQKKVAAKYGVKDFPSLVVLPAGGAEPVTYSGKLGATELAEFLGQYAPAARGKAESSTPPPPPPPPPRKPELHYAEDQAQFDAACPGGVCVIAFLNKEHDEHELHKQVLLEAAKEQYKNFNFVWVDGVAHAAFGGHFGVTQDLPAAVVYNPKKKAYTPYVGAFSADAVSSFLSKVLLGKRRSVPLDGAPSF